MESPPKKGPKPLINTAIILNRSPILTRTLSDFEIAYHAYQARLRRALHNPFPYEFYFKEGSIIETRFVVEERKREREAFGPSFGLDDDLDKAKAAAARAAAAQLAEQEGEHEAMMPREHPADISNNVESLDRKGMRNLYLVLKTTNKEDREVWRFPQGRIQKGELLHQAAQRSLADECDQYMDSWIVSRNPIGNEPRSQATFFYKAHIMAGQVRPTEGINGFAWLTKQEIEKHVDKHYWDGVKDILSDY
ncbi:hypothetical protein BDZ89DRAFT_1061655 [Hymenopellis radicata]|nr:hypothetical protein BDZ89DRAFT_1061655 [Hymenopellis radicata]